jgi:hypothetical protein
MSQTNFILRPFLQASSPPNRLPGVPVARRTWRRWLVSTALISADLGGGFVVMQTTGTLTRASFAIGAWAPLVLVLIYGGLGLYGGFGPCPYERLRLRAQGIGLLILSDCAIGIVAGRMPRAACVALMCPSLLLVGQYLEAYARTILIRRELWGGAAVFVGAGEHSGKLARYLQHHPEFGLRPAGFVRVAQEDTHWMPQCLPALGGIADLEHRASWIEVLIFRSAADTAALSPALWRHLEAKQLVMVGDSDDLPSLGSRPEALAA